jgi:hypothetical protein
MSLTDLGYRLRDKVASLLNDERRFIKLISRLGFLGLVSAIILSVAPTSADENTPEVEQTPVEIIDTATAIVETITETVVVMPPVGAVPAVPPEIELLQVVLPDV